MSKAEDTDQTAKFPESEPKTQNLQNKTDIMSRKEIKYTVNYVKKAVRQP